MHRILTTSVASVSPHDVAKVERKGGTKAGLDEAIEWLTGCDEAALDRHRAAGTTFDLDELADELAGQAPREGRAGVSYAVTTSDMLAW